MYSVDDSSSGSGGDWGPYNLPGAQSYSTTMPAFASLPETRPLEYLARRRRPSWGLRFLFLLVVAGGAAYALKPWVPWVADRVTPVEQLVRGQIAKVRAKYQTTIAPMIGLGEPAPAVPAPVTSPPPSPVAPVAARPVVEVPPRPGIEPIVPRATRTGSATPATVLPASARVVVPQRGAMPGKAFGRGGLPATRAGVRYLGAGDRAVRPGGRAARAGGKASAMSRAAARRAAKLSMLARARSARAAAMAAAAAARAEAASPSAAEIAAPEPAVAEVPTPELPAAPSLPPSPPPSKEPAAVASAQKMAPPPAAAAEEEDRSVNSLVQSAARSGDELDRLMAGAVQSRQRTQGAGPGGPGGGNDGARAASGDQTALERKLADVQKPRAAAAAANAAGISRQPLSRSDIQVVMQDVQKNVRDCFRQHGKGGAADVKVDVAPEGNVIGTIIRGELAGTPTGACVETRLKAATFPPSTGMRFDYRLLVK
jgi:hypothetical protein